MPVCKMVALTFVILLLIILPGCGLNSVAIPPTPDTTPMNTS